MMDDDGSDPFGVYGSSSLEETDSAEDARFGIKEIPEI